MDYKKRARIIQFLLLSFIITLGAAILFASPAYAEDVIINEVIIEWKGDTPAVGVKVGDVDVTLTTNPDMPEGYKSFSRNFYHSHGGNALEPDYVFKAELYNWRGHLELKDGYSFSDDVKITLEGTELEKSSPPYGQSVQFSLPLDFYEYVTVTFDSDGGSEEPPHRFVKGHPVKEPEDPTKAGFIFQGWYLGADLYDFSQIVNDDMTLKAKWEPDPTKVIITFDADGGTPAPPPQVIDKGTAATEPDEPKKLGYEFVGWFRLDPDPPEHWDFSNVVNNSMTLTAYYMEKSYPYVLYAYRPATGEGFTNVKFTVTNPGPPATTTVYTTPIGGKVFLDLKYGQEVTAEETVLPPGFYLGGPGPYAIRVNDEEEIETKNLADGSATWEVSDPLVTFYHYKDWPIYLVKVGEDNPTEPLAGAEIEVSGPASDTVFKETSGTPEFQKDILVAEAMPYVIRENVAPAGYVKGGDIVFHVDGNGEVVIDSGDAKAIKSIPSEDIPAGILLTNEKEVPPPELYEIQVMAQRKLTGENLAGAKVEYIDVADPGFKMDLTTIAGPFPVQLQKGKVYRFTETTAPTGFKLWGYASFECMMDDKDDFLVRPTGDENPWVKTDPKHVIFSHVKEFLIYLSKVAEDAPDVEQSGATLKLNWPSGLPDMFVGESGAPDFPKQFPVVEGVSYTYSEEKAPKGYEKHEDIVFHLDEDGKVVVESGEAVIIPGEHPTIVMVNKKLSEKPTPGDTPPKKLPDTGGGMTSLGMWGAVLLLLGASVLFVTLPKTKAHKNH